MSSDFSRKTFDPKKHYSAVQKQQGRVDLDADWNEQNDIVQHRTRTETRDVIGASGVPKKGNSFKIIPKADATDLLISSGHMYAGGLLCELESPYATYLNQPYYPTPDISFFDVNGSPPASPPLLKLKDGTYLVYIDAWQREVNYLDDPRIQEVALGEADTATRLQNVWQVKLLPVTAAGAKCKSDIAEWNDLISAPTGKLNAQTKIVDDNGNPCVLPPSSGYRRLENQLYRVEIQKGGNLAGTTFKWSRDNATVETKIESVNGSIITVADTGKDEVLGFADGQWVEIVSEEATLKSTPYPLVRILEVNPAIREITLSSSVPSNITGVLKLRRWDQSVPQATADGLQAISGWNDLEDGIQVSFSPGTYRAGDYWLIPARVATGEIEWPPYSIPNLAPEEQPPLGINHAYCRLALLTVQAGNITNYQDCRPLFPSLTEICAEDICFDNNNCDFPQVSNVQQAIDLLCAADDLREHNKLLHGLGVICGLKIKCRVFREGVIIEKGSALDCEGNMIHIKNQNGLVYDLVEKAKEKGFIDDKGYGQVCLSIARGANNGPEIGIEKYEEPKFWDAVLEGTLLKDFYEDCIKNLIDFLQEQLSFPITDQVPVPVSQRRITALLNLFYSALNSKSGPYGFISGNNEKGMPEGNEGDGPTEDQLLREFYNDLKELLASETFCAMFDKDDPYPDYLLDDGLDTIFGTPLRTHFRLRLHPGGNFAYTCGNNNKVYVYDLGKKELIQSVNFPSDSTIKVRDIAISEKGDKIFGVGILNDKDSVFAKGTIKNDGLIEWGVSSIKTDIKFVSLALISSEELLGIGKAQGLFMIKGIGLQSFAADVMNPFNATGLMVLSEETRMVVAAIDTSKPIGDESSEFNSLIIVNPGNPTGGQHFLALSGTDFENDIAISDNIVYATGNNKNGIRVIAAFDLNKEGQQTDEVQIDSTSFLRLAHYSTTEERDFLLVTMADALKVARVRVKGGNMQMDGKFRIPVQLAPLGIAIDGKNHAGYVLNSLVNTITSMNMHKVFHQSPAPDYTQEPPVNLALYREGAIEAYKDVLSHILQYLKDCFCDKFIIDCPDCDEDEKVYLGCVEVRDFQVYNICNFSKRKYVKSFRTVEYWLSTVPVLPIVKQAFTMFCCTVLDIKDDKKNRF